MTMSELKAGAGAVHESETADDENEAYEAVAIVGLAGRFPGAKTLDDFWDNLKNGVESIRFFTDEELAGEGVPAHLLGNPAYVKARAALDDIDLFDAAFFGFTPREAEMADPQHRIFLECVWEALEDAGCDAARYPGVIGLYGGGGINSYLINNLLTNRRLIDAMGLLQTAMINRADHLTTHTAYKLNLKGPSVTVQTACSTSLVAVHMACQALISYHCDMALAGGVAVSTPNRIGYLHQEGGIGSPDGHCRAFDAQANGTVSGSGAGVVALKRLSDALAEGDVIRAVIRSTAVNNDGSDKIGYSAPSVSGQAQAIAMAQAIAGISAEEISYIEAHGTGTPLGDPIEIEALTQAFRSATERKGFCAIGSVKTNIGHLDTAAGIAGLIKTTLALQHRQLPPSLHFSEPNPRIDFAGSPFRVNATLQDWETDGAPRMAGVSSFGIGGTNAHVIVEEAPAVARPPSSRRRHLLVLSAKTKSALETMGANLADHLRKRPALDLGDVAYTLQVGRRALGQRRALVCRDRDDAVSVLGMSDVGRVVTGAKEAVNHPVAFMFPGQGSQHVNAAADLYAAEEIFRREVDRCATLLEPHLGRPLQELLFAPEGRAAQTAETLRRTKYAQPALFVIEYALARLFMEWGIQPQAMIGHSLGEYAAACLSGVFSLEDGLKLVAARGALMDALPEGGMLSVSLSEEETRARLGSRIGRGLELAAVNSPSLCVVSGGRDAVAAFESDLIEQGVGCLRLHTSHAFHSSMMEPIIGDFLRVFDDITLQPPSRPYVSTLTGGWIANSEATSPSYWAEHLRRPVQFGRGLGVLFEDPARILLEVGPGRALMSIARRHPQKAAGQMVLHSLPAPDSNRSSADVALLTLGQLWTSGVEPDWDALHASDPRGRAQLPTYPFERKRYWIDAGAADAAGASGSLEKDPDPSNWFYVPSWKRAVQPAQAGEAGEAESGRWLFFIDGFGVAAQMADWMRPFALNVITVAPAERFARLGALEYELDPSNPEDYQRLFDELERESLTPDRIVHAWGVVPPAPEPAASDPSRAAPASFYSLLYIAQALGPAADGRSIHIDIVAANVNEVTGAEALCPDQSTLAGPRLVIPQEYAGVACRLIDIDFAETAAQSDGPPAARLPQDLLEDLREPGVETVAYRNGHRWAQVFEQVRLEEAPDLPFRLREGGVYLITGGLGGMGLAVAGYLARTVRGARLALVGRSPLPPREQWREWLETHGEESREGAAIASVLALETDGAQADYFSADVSDAKRLNEVVAQIGDRFGPVDGVFHAAGVPGDGLIQLKTADKADKVLAAKVGGARALFAALDAQRADGGRLLDFAILCSSRSALLGGLGSVDYTAANAFLDAFAHKRRKRTGEFVVSVNWPAWQDVGMLADTAAAHRAARDASARPAAPREEYGEDRPEDQAAAPFIHPLIDRYVFQGPDRHVFRSRFAVSSHWVLDEHRILGAAVAPGVTYLEMARAAFQKAVHAGATEISDVYFLTPLRMKDDEARDVRLVLERSGEAYDFHVESAPSTGAGEDGAWLRHVIGKISARPDVPPRRVDVPSLIAECGRRDLRLTEENFFDESLGPRWQCANRIHSDDDRLVAELRLPDEYCGDLEHFRLHPALLDRAAGIGLLFLVEHQGGYLPFSYGKLTFHAPMRQRMYIYSRGGQDLATNAEMTCFDVDIIAEDGTVLAEIERFSHKRINEIGKAVSTLMAGNLFGDDRLPAAPREAPRKAAPSHYDEALSRGVSPAEGVDVFARMLARSVPPQVVVSPNSLPAVIEWARQANADSYEARAEALPAPSTHARPGLETDFVPPANDLERRLAAVWRECLGIDEVGRHDNFFELGGNSVLAIQIMANAKKAGLSFNVQQLFQYPTIAELAVLMGGAEMDAHAGSDRTAPLLPAQRRFFASLADGLRPAGWSLLLEADPAIDMPSLEQRVLSLFAAYDALRLRFSAAGPQAAPSVASVPERAPLETVDIGGVAQADRLQAIADVAERIRSEFRMEEGPLVRFVFFRTGDGERPALLIVGHPAAVDLDSVRILIGDLQSAAGPAPGERGSASPGVLTAADWAHEFAQSSTADREMDFWSAMRDRPLSSWPAAAPERGADTPSPAFFQISLEPRDTRALLEKALRAYHARVEDFALAALVNVLCARAGENHVWIDYHSRLDRLPGGSLKDAVGPFASIAPIVLEAPGGDDPGALLTSVKEQLRAVPRAGSTFDLVRIMRGDAESPPQPAVAFAYLGAFEDAPSPANGLRLHSSAPLIRNETPATGGYALTVQSFVLAGRLHVNWGYDRMRADEEAVQNLADAHRNGIKALIDHCVAVDAEVYTPSDFPLADLNSKKLEHVFKLLEKADKSITQ